MLKTFSKMAIKFILVKLKLIHLFFLFAPKGRLVILSYHRISENKCEDPLSPFDVGVTKDKFEKQMKYLNRHFSILSLSQAIELLEKGKDWPKFPVVVSFDDGYRDIYLNAFPILEKHNLAAIVFVSTRFVEERNSFWWDEIKSFVENNCLEEIQLALDNNLSPEYHLDLSNLKTKTDKRIFLEKLTEELKKLKGKYRDELLNKLKSFLKSDQKGKTEILSWEEIKKLRKAGIEFGSHTRSHYLLTFEDEKTVEEELKFSKQSLEEHLEEKILFLSYPSGLYNSKVEKIAKNSGYKAGLSTLYGYNKKETDFFALKRFSLGETQSMDDFVFSLGRLFGALPFLKE